MFPISQYLLFFLTPKWYREYLATEPDVPYLTEQAEEGQDRDPNNSPKGEDTKTLDHNTTAED